MPARFSTWSLLRVSFALTLGASACGGAAPVSPPAEPAAANTAAAQSAAPTTPAAASDTAPTAGAAPSADTADAAPKPEPKAAPDPNATREVTYVVVPEGLKISVAGVKFMASSVAELSPAGWGVKVSVEASADDGKAHSLTKPKAGPLAFAGSVLRKGKTEPEHFGDERTGDGEEAISADSPTKFSRNWPLKGTRPLAIGDTLDLQVALWGLGTDADSRRPVKQFFRVRMQVGTKGKPKAIIEPPASAAGK
jgi:hypothetical protein